MYFRSQLQLKILDTIYKVRMALCQPSRVKLGRHTRIIEENDSIRKELEGCKDAKYERKEIITSLECWLMDALSTIETRKAEMELGSAREIEASGSVTCNGDRLTGRPRLRLPSHQCSKALVTRKRWRISFGTWRITQA